MEKKKIYQSPEIAIVDSMKITILAGSDRAASTAEPIEDATNEKDDEGKDFNDFMGN